MQQSARQSVQTNHARGNRLVRDFINQDEAARGATAVIRICCQWLLHAESDAPDAIQWQGIAAVLLLGIDIQE